MWDGTLFRSNDREAALREMRDELLNEIAELRSDVQALNTEREKTSKVNDLQRQIASLEIAKDKLIEDNDRKIRETEHSVGLLRTKQDHDIEHATRMAKLEVAESNLTTERESFKKDMDFRTEQMKGEMERFEAITEKILQRLPDLNATLTLKQSGKA